MWTSRKAFCCEVEFRCEQCVLGSPSLSQHRGRTHAGQGQGLQTGGGCAPLFPYHTAPHSWPHASEALLAPPLSPPTGCKWGRTALAHPDTLEVQRTHLNIKLMDSLVTMSHL